MATTEVLFAIAIITVQHMPIRESGSKTGIARRARRATYADVNCGPPFFFEKAELPT